MRIFDVRPGSFTATVDRGGQSVAIALAGVTLRMSTPLAYEFVDVVIDALDGTEPPAFALSVADVMPKRKRN
ncbi:hypothetical protein [Rhodococcus pyridinivorans]|jgi:hypothetical protein|uniref:hypothetical protein n=1 Tax=Rhodococcus pyridinivorans TaxID=103816 RepID=UPI00110D708C|nr:hypothetical protein [Rhodococcus pyridinivorans]